MEANEKRNVCESSFQKIKVTGAEFDEAGGWKLRNSLIE
jgi:hypothetical protein